MNVLPRPRTVLPGSTRRGPRQVTGDREADSASAARATAGAVDPVETVEDVRQMLGGDADPGVCDGDRDPATIDACPDLHPAAGRRVLERVFQEEDLADPIRVGQHLRKPGRDIDRQGHFLVIELRAEPRGRSLHEIPGPDAARVHGHEAGLGAGQFLQVIHEPLEAYGLSADQVERLGLRRDHAMHEAFYVTGDARQRRPSFMRYVRHEIPARGFCLLERSGHLVEVRGELSEFFGREYRDPLAVSSGGDSGARPCHRTDNAPGDEEADRERGEDCGDRCDGERGGHRAEHAVEERCVEFRMLA